MGPPGAHLALIPDTLRDLGPVPPSLSLSILGLFVPDASQWQSRLPELQRTHQERAGEHLKATGAPARWRQLSPQAWEAARKETSGVGGWGR